MRHLQWHIPAHLGVRFLLAVVIAVIAPTARAQSPGFPAQGASVPNEILAYPDLVLLNGKVLTVDAQFTVEEAVAVRDGRILAVGSSEDIRRLRHPLLGSPRRTRTACRVRELASRPLVDGLSGRGVTCEP